MLEVPEQSGLVTGGAGNCPSTGLASTGRASTGLASTEASLQELVLLLPGLDQLEARLAALAPTDLQLLPAARIVPDGGGRGGGDHPPGLPRHSAVSHHSKQLDDSLQVVPPTPPLVTASLQAGLAKEDELLLLLKAVPTPELLTTIQLAGVSETTGHLTVPVPTSRLTARPTMSAAPPTTPVGQLEELAAIQRAMRERVAMAEQEQKS